MQLVTTTAVIAAICLAGAANALIHDCIHDEPTLMNEQRRLLDLGLSTQSYSRVPGNPTLGPIFPADEAQPIRIKFDTTGLTQAGAYCTAQGDIVPSYKTVGDTVTCGFGQTLTASARSYIVDTLLPAAAAKVTNVVKVQPLTANLRVPSTTTCGDTPIPASHVSTGIANVDLVIYVTAAPLGSGVFTFAFSGACNRDQSQRIVVGKLNIDPNRQSFTDDERVRMIVHELYHILGVSAVEMFRASNKQLEFKRGKQVAVSVLPQVTSWVQTFTGCAGLSGAEFEDENVGASLSSSSHWERLLYFEEIMTAKPGTAVSGLTLAFLAGINVGYTTNTASGDFMYWGNQQGCGLHENSCTTAAGGMGKLFCPDTSSTANQCTYDRGAIGYCAPDFFINGCNKIQAYSNRICNVEAAETDDDLKYGYVYAADSRCLEAKDVHREDFTPYFADFPVCFNTRCSANKVEFRSPNDGTWATCDTEGQLVLTPGTDYTGSIVCPNAIEFCRTHGIFIPAPTPAPPTPVPATPTPPTPIPATPVPGAPVTPTPPTPVPATPIPGMPVTPTPATPIPATPVPGAPVTPAPPTPVPATPIPGMPVTPAPPTPVPATPIPGMPVTPTPPVPTPIPGTPVTPAPGGSPPGTPSPTVGAQPPDSPSGAPPATTSGSVPSLTTFPAGGVGGDDGSLSSAFGAQGGRVAAVVAVVLVAAAATF